MKFKVFLTMIFASFFCIAGVNADTINVSSGDDLASKVASANSGDTLVIANGTYNGDITIDKNITLKGASKDGVIIDGSILINAEGINVDLQNLTIQDNGMDVAMVNLLKPAYVNIDNCKIAYKGYTDSDYGNSDYAVGVKLGRDVADGSDVSIINSEIYAKYGIWVYGANNTVYIESSQITGWAPLDISNGSSAQSLASNNYVEVIGSTLTGVANLTGASNDYGTIVIGGQDNLGLYIDSSIITNKFNVNNTQDLILYGDAYLDSKNVVVSIVGSELINNAPEGNDSAVYNIGTSENASISANNSLQIYGDSMITSSNDKIYSAVDGTVVVMLHIDILNDAIGLGPEYMEYIAIVPNGTAFDDIEAFKNFEAQFDGYEFWGLYVDVYDEGESSEFDRTLPLTSDTTVYATFNLIAEEENSTSNNNSTNNYNDVDKNLDDVPYTGDLFNSFGYQTYLVR